MSILQISHHTPVPNLKFLSTDPLMTPAQGLSCWFRRCFARCVGNPHGFCTWSPGASFQAPMHETLIPSGPIWEYADGGLLGRSLPLGAYGVPIREQKTKVGHFISRKSSRHCNFPVGLQLPKKTKNAKRNPSTFSLRGHSVGGKPPGKLLWTTISVIVVALHDRSKLVDSIIAFKNQYHSKQTLTI